jgi:hypothetical protein
VPSDLVGSGGGVWTEEDEGNIVFTGSDTAGLWAIPASGGMGRDLLALDRNAESDFHEIDALPEGRGLIVSGVLAASFSPDGRYLTYESLESGRSEIYVRPFPEGEGRVQVSTGGGISPLWSMTGEIFYMDGSAILAASIATSGGSPAVSKPMVLFQTRGDTNLAPVFEVTPDGKTFYMLRSRGRDQVSVILNWPRDLAQIEATGRSAGR